MHSPVRTPTVPVVRSSLSDRSPETSHTQLWYGNVESILEQEKHLGPLGVRISYWCFRTLVNQTARARLYVGSLWMHLLPTRPGYPGPWPLATY